MINDFRAGRKTEITLQAFNQLARDVETDAAAAAACVAYKKLA